MSARDVITNEVERIIDCATEWTSADTDAILAALRAAGFAVVPVEPTERMCKAGWVAADRDDGCAGTWEGKYCAYCESDAWNGGGCRGMAVAAYRTMIAATQDPTP